MTMDGLNRVFIYTMFAACIAASSYGASVLQCGNGMCDQLNETVALCPEDCTVCDPGTIGSTICRQGGVFQCTDDTQGRYSYQHMITCQAACVPQLGVCADPGHGSCMKPGGNDIFTRGETLVDSASVLDSCADDNTLIETYCNARTLVTEARLCEWGCREGACLRGKRLLCENEVTSVWHSGECQSCPPGYALRACEKKGWLFIKRSEVCFATKITQCGPSPLCDSGWNKTDTLECLLPTI